VRIAPAPAYRIPYVRLGITIPDPAAVAPGQQQRHQHDQQQEQEPDQHRLPSVH